MHPPAYATAMKGTSFSQTLDMDSTPPKMTTETRITITTPTAHAGTATFEVMMPAIADACTADPVPMAAMAANAANATAPSFAHQGVRPPGPGSSSPLSLRRNARSQMYMAPPSMAPLWSFTRYFTAAYTSAYLVAMPNTPVIHIQNTAPGPPARMAVATPTMEPVPMVAASAVASAPMWLMSPLPSGSEVSESLMAWGSLRWMKPVFTVKNRCEPKRSAIMAGPHTKLSMVLRISNIISLLYPRTNRRRKIPVGYTQTVT